MRTIEKGREPRSLWGHRMSGGTYGNYQKTEDVRDALLRDQGHICCFCMKRITARSMKIAHWASQSENDDSTVDWENLLGACAGGDGERGAIKHCDTSQGNTRLKVNPNDAVQRCEHLIRYRADGEMTSDDEDIRRDLQVTLNLNNERLKPRRAEIYDVLIRRLRERESAVGEYWPRERIERELRAWARRDSEAKFREFCQVAIYFLEKWLRRKV